MPHLYDNAHSNIKLPITFLAEFKITQIEQLRQASLQCKKNTSDITTSLNLFCAVFTDTDNMCVHAKHFTLHAERVV